MIGESTAHIKVWAEISYNVRKMADGRLLNFSLPSPHPGRGRDGRRQGRGVRGRGGRGRDGRDRERGYVREGRGRRGRGVEGRDRNVNHYSDNIYV